VPSAVMTRTQPAARQPGTIYRSPWLFAFQALSPCPGVPRRGTPCRSCGGVGSRSSCSSSSVAVWERVLPPAGCWAAVWAPARRFLPAPSRRVERGMAGAVGSDSGSSVSPFSFCRSAGSKRMICRSDREDSTGATRVPVLQWPRKGLRPGAFTRGVPATAVPCLVTAASHTRQCGRQPSRLEARILGRSTRPGGTPFRLDRS